MIAAAPSIDSSLGLVQLIFSLVANPPQSVPDELKAHLKDVIEEAKALLVDPEHISSNQANPEAIALALEMRASAALNESVTQITSFESIDPILANKVLKGIGGTYPAY